jgi:hypothetical protein
MIRCCKIFLSLKFEKFQQKEIYGNKKIISNLELFQTNSKKSSKIDNNY